jgi:patatin-like phospholipase/acyl hydrolase
MRVLSIDGGGVRAVTAVPVLAELERLTRTPVAELFDLITASSTGAVVGLGLVAPDRHGRARESAAEIHRLWLESGQDFVPARPPWTVRALGRLRSSFQPEYPMAAPALASPGSSVSAISSPTPRGARALQSYLGEIPFGASRCDLVVPVHDLAAGRALRCRSREFGQHRSPSMADVARASCALPAPGGAVHMSLGNSRLNLAHGGFVADNPALFAYTSALSRRDGDDDSDIVLLSLGTHSETNSMTADQTAPRKAPRWSKDGYISTLVDGSNNAQHQLLESFADTRPDVRYSRFEVSLNGCDPALHSRNPRDVACLASAAERAVYTRRPELERIAEELEA